MGFSLLYISKVFFSGSALSGEFKKKKKSLYFPLAGERDIGFDVL